MWSWLVGAIIAGVIGTISLRFSATFSRLGPSILVVLAYGTAFVALSQALVRGMLVGVAYGIWVAAGVALVALIGNAFLGESLTLIQISGIALIIGGILVLGLAASHV
jgi:small multidrug resistance pump